MTCTPEPGSRASGLNCWNGTRFPALAYINGYSGRPAVCDVLVLEDEALVRMVVVAILEGDGLHVREAATPGEAMDAIVQPPGCSLLVTDIDLGVPGVDGFSVA